MQKIKFKVTIEKLSFEFEGSREMGQALQSGLTNTLGSLLKTQHTVMAALPTKPEPTIFDAIEPTELPPAPEKPKRASRKNNGQPSIPTCIRTLKTDGFFGTPRTAREIQEHLKTSKGYNFSSSSMSGPLQKLTQDGELHRETFDETLHYQDKPFSESQRTQKPSAETPQ